ncbi:unnamed protein product [Amoebophrya sp. A25]|nr:unnamed protein product [Amoebophrya sp. A25]|eukprot:GSA25T00027755001.1
MESDIVKDAAVSCTGGDCDNIDEGRHDIEVTESLNEQNFSSKADPSTTSEQDVSEQQEEPENKTSAAPRADEEKASFSEGGSPVRRRDEPVSLPVAAQLKAPLSASSQELTGRVKLKTTSEAAATQSKVAPVTDFSQVDESHPIRDVCEQQEELENFSGISSSPSSIASSPPVDAACCISPLRRVSEIVLRSVGAELREPLPASSQKQDQTLTRRIKNIEKEEKNDGNYGAAGSSSTRSSSSSGSSFEKTGEPYVNPCRSAGSLALGVAFLVGALLVSVGWSQWDAPEPRIASRRKMNGAKEWKQGMRGDELEEPLAEPHPAPSSSYTERQSANNVKNSNYLLYQEVPGSTIRQRPICLLLLPAKPVPGFFLTHTSARLMPCSS